jgi:dTDP-4-dehydrorhamnose 3,5-epimerase
VKVLQTELPGVLVIEPQLFADGRGFFLETFRAEGYRAAGIPGPFVQDNVSYSEARVLRGLHFQNPKGQGKLVFAVAGEIFDVAVDVRFGSPTFGRWTGARLTGDTGRQIYIPEGFAHGFCVLSGHARVAYKCTAVYDPASEMSVIWNDPDIGIAWPVDSPRISSKDAGAPRLRDIDRARLPRFGTGH